jgi:hypothetical protein
MRNSGIFQITIPHSYGRVGSFWLICERVVLRAIIFLRERRPLLWQRRCCIACCEKCLRYRSRYLKTGNIISVSPDTDLDMTLSYEKTRTIRRLKDLLPSEQTKQGDRVLKAAAELLERRKRFTDRENYIMARGLLTM